MKYAFLLAHFWQIMLRLRLRFIADTLPISVLRLAYEYNTEKTYSGHQPSQLSQNTLHHVHHVHDVQTRSSLCVFLVHFKIDYKKSCHNIEKWLQCQWQDANWAHNMSHIHQGKNSLFEIGQIVGNWSVWFSPITHSNKNGLLLCHSHIDLSF